MVTVDGDGARRVVQNLVDQISSNYGFYLRKAREKDSLLVFNLSNDRIVRINSINQSPIKLNEHSEWFIGKLINETCLFFLAFNKADSFIGQVRYDISQSNALINISIDKDFRGKHFAAPLIFTSSFRLLKEKPFVQTITAFIRPQNIPSIKAFAKAGYNQSPDEILNDERYIVYKLVRQ